MISSPFDYHNLTAAGFLSPTGQCKPFDAAADGYCRGEGVAVVIMKRLSDAFRDGDNILGVISGSAANQNHNENLITVPHSGSQSALYNEVVKLSGIQPNAVSYVEAHGTGTGVGDPVEVRSIRDVFGGPQRDSLLHFASIKGNIGHTEGTAGVAGLIKVLLMMRHRLIPKQASHNSMNPKIPTLETDRIAIPREILPWEAPFLAACVNSYGAAGSNSALAVLEKPLLSSGTPENLSSISQWPLVLTANSANNLAMYGKKLVQWLQDHKARPDILASLIYHLATRANHALPHIVSTTVSNIPDLESKLEAPSLHSTITESPKPVVLVFGGQESDFVGLSRDIYRSSKIFRDLLNACNDACVASGLESFLPYLFDQEPIKNLVTLHSALFAVQFASAKTWIACGLKVSAVVGHSFGHLTALAVSGVLSLSDAIILVSGRASLMVKHWGDELGSMLFLRTDRQTITRALSVLKAEGKNHYAQIACHNGPKSYVVVGSSASVSALEQYFTTSSEDPVRTKKLQVTHSFHSKFTEPLLPYLRNLASKLSWNSPATYLEFCEEEERTSALDVDAIAEHTRQPVFFQQAIERLSKRYTQGVTWIEAGRGSSVINLVKGSVQEAQGHSFFSPQLTMADAQVSLTNVTVGLWNVGQSVQYWPFHKSQKLDYGAPLSLPPYQFEKPRHWLPFTGNRVHKNEPEPVREVATEEKHKILKFVGFKDSSKSEAVFRIDPAAERFKIILGGHVMAGQGLCPASLYFELVSRAALQLEQAASASTHVPTVHDLVMKSPIGTNTNVDILLNLKRLSGLVSSWEFCITTTNFTDTGRHLAPFEVSTGRVLLKQREDAQNTKLFSRYESLIGGRRVEEVVKHPGAEMMQGNHIYRAFTTVVYYGPVFRGIKRIAAVGLEAAGKVIIAPDKGPDDQRLCDTPMTDSFMQFAGFLVNYFNSPSTEDVFVCGKIEHIEIGGAFNPDANEWMVYANMVESEDSTTAADAYVFEAESKKMVMAIFGLRFNKMSQTLLGRMLRSVNKTSVAAAEPVPLERDVPIAIQEPIVAAVEAPTGNLSRSKRHELFQLLSEITDIPLEDFKNERTLEELGIDSLMATEVLNNVRSVLGLTIDLTNFTFFANIGAFVAHVDERLGLNDGQGHCSDSAPTPAASWDMVSSRPTSPVPITINEKFPFEEGLAYAPQQSSTPTESANPLPEKNVPRPTLTSAASDFRDIKQRYDQLAEGVQGLEFWSEAYPDQSRLVLAYVVEAFAKLGCDVRKLAPGDDIPTLQGVLDKHNRLICQLFRILEHCKLIFPSTDQSFARTDTPVDSADAKSIFHEIIDLHPQHGNVNRLVRIVGSKLADCLLGKTDGIQTVFGNKEAKKILEDIYEFWPLFRTPTLVVGDFLAKALTNATGSGKFRILEIGAGTGDTTRYLVALLKSHGIPFEYMFTEISSSLVTAAKQQFRGVEGMSFEVLNIEHEPKAEHNNAFHCIIATNTIHATRDLDVSLRHLRTMLREDGALVLVEITRQIYWLDIVFGQFEGWWLFEDDRLHALIDEDKWDCRMRKAGFNEVLWSDGASPESKTVRAIAGFPSGSEVVKKPATPVKAALETVVYKRVGDLNIHADTYYPASGELPVGKMPVGKLRR